MMEDKKRILALEAITKTYRSKKSFFSSEATRVVALNQVGFTVYEGEIFGLVGESGSGKTTAGRLIVHLEEPDAGRIFLEGTEITGLSGKALKDFRRRVQMIFQDPYQSLNPQLSIFESVSEPLTIHRVGDPEAQRRQVLDILKTVGLSPPEEYMYRYPHQLSGGQRQRVAIARAMILEPAFVVADEPTSMLDASYSAQIFNILLAVRKQFNVTILFITHSLSAARYLCDRVAVIYRGHLMELGPADDIIQHPRHPYTRALIDALPRFGHCGAVKPYDTLLEQPREGTNEVGCAFFPRCKIAHRVRCSREAPPLKSLSPDHLVACFYQEPATDAPQDGEACYYGT